MKTILMLCVLGLISCTQIEEPDAFDSIELGMRKPEVEMLVGKPEQIHSDTVRNVIYDSWFYTSRNRYVQFECDSVISVTNFPEYD